jgi:hypothetical protein
MEAEAERDWAAKKPKGPAEPPVQAARERPRPCDGGALSSRSPRFTKGVGAVSQQGQLIRLKSMGRDEEPLWA